MVMLGPWQDRLEEIFGVHGGPLSRDRTVGQQNDLYRRGATNLRGTQSPHTRQDYAIDLPIRMDPAEAERRAAAAGVQVDFIYESGGHHRGTGPHLHGEHRPADPNTIGSMRTRSRPGAVSGGTQVAANTPARPLRPIRDVTADELLGSVLGADGQEIPSNQGRHPLINPFEVEGTARQRMGRVEEALSAQDQFLSHFDKTLEDVQGRRRERVERSVETRREINDTVEAETRGMIERVEPILRQRASTAKQLEHLAGMNPLERGLRGIFDLNYNQGHMEERLHDFDTVLQSVGQDFQYLTGLRERLMNTVTAGDQNEAQLEQLDLTELDEQGRSVNMALTAANQSFSFLGDVVNQNENIVRAQIATVDRFLTEQTTGNLASLEAQAERAPGQNIVVDGVELSLGEIRARRLNSEAQDMAFESQRLALQAGHQQVADQAATMWARNATRTQIEAAINNGGVAGNGMRIPQDVLTAQLSDRMQREQLVAGNAQLGDPVRAFGQTARSFSNEIRTIGGRAQSLFGTVPQELVQSTSQYAQEAQQMAQRIREASESGRPEVAAALNQRLNALRENFSSQIDRVVQRHSAGNASVAGWMRAYLTGADIDSGQASDAMIYYAQRGSLPAGMRASPQARAAFQAARTAIQQVDTQIGRRNISNDERQRLYREAINRSVPQAYNGNSFNILVDQIPEAAQRLNDPFRGVRREDFRAARASADSVPFQEMARELGITANDARLLFSGDGSGYRGSNRAELLTRIQNDGLRGQLLARQQQVFIDVLDSSPSSTPNFRPSRALAELLQRPEMYRMAGNMELLGRNTSYGDFLISGMTQGSLAERFQQWGDRYQQQIQDQEVAQTAQNRTTYQMWRNNPALYARTVLAATPGLNQHDEALLMQAINADPRTQSTMRDAVAQLPLLGGVGNARERARQMIVGQRFQNPELERIRRIAADAWDDVAAQMDSAIEAYHGQRSESGPTSNF